MIGSAGGASQTATASGGGLREAAGRHPRKLRLWEKYLRSFDGLLIVLFVGGTVAAVLYGFVAGGTAANEAAKPEAVALRGALVAAALVAGAGALGALAGFLFGLPRTLTSNELRDGRREQDPSAAAPPATAAEPASGVETADMAAAQANADRAAEADTARTSYNDVNTNLEQISDWLTKIIVGVGLTQLNEVPDHLARFGDEVNPFFRFGGEIFAIGGGLYFLIIGFFLGYVGTRVRLSLVFSTSQRNIIDISQRRDLAEDVESRTAFRLAATTSPIDSIGNETVNSADALVLSKSLADLSTVDQLRARANALARSQRPQEARDLYEHILKRIPATADLLADYAQVLGLAGQGEKAAEVLSTATVLSSSTAEASDATRKVDAAAVRGRIVAGLEGKDGYTYETAISAIEDLLRQEDQARDPALHGWLACAYGQKFAITHDEADRAKVHEAVGKAIQLDPAQKELLATLYYPSRVAGAKKDLQPLWPDPVMDALLFGPDDGLLPN